MEVEVELIKEDNEQLVTQYEREKGFRKSAEARLMELEDHFDGDKKETNAKIESLTSIVKMFELKAKNSQEQSMTLMIFLVKWEHLKTSFYTMTIMKSVSKSSFFSITPR